MRSTKQTKIQKSGAKTKISKKNNARKSHRAWGFSNDVSIANLDNINEIIRVRKTQRAEGRGSWKLVPKDSCEVYKERRRKQLESQDQDSDESLSEDSQRRRKRNKTRDREIDRRVNRKPLKNTRKNRRRPYSDSSVPSRTSWSSMSTSCASTSDMEYE